MFDECKWSIDKKRLGREEKKRKLEGEMIARYLQKFSNMTEKDKQKECKEILKCC